VELVKKYQDNDRVVFWSINGDDLPDRENALKFLEKKQAAFPNYLVATGKENKSLDFFDIGGLPAAFIYDAQGKQVASFGGGPEAKPYTYADVEQKLQELLKATGS
jgi:hypothetical protein